MSKLMPELSGISRYAMNGQQCGERNEAIVEAGAHRCASSKGAEFWPMKTISRQAAATADLGQEERCGFGGEERLRARVRCIPLFSWRTAAFPKCTCISTP